MSIRPQTQNAGASLERQAIMAWAKRNMRGGPRAGYSWALEELIEYLNKRTKRFNTNAGGLGKKRGVAK